jgi:DNA polymerase-3 subunit beta
MKGNNEMKIICTKADLLNGINICSKAVPSKTTMSILECILIDARKDSIKLIANDMELGIETVIKGKIEEKGMIALDSSIFMNIVRKLPDSDVNIVNDQSYKTTIVCEKAKFNIMGKPGDEFSFLPEIKKDREVVISHFTLREIIRQTIFSIAENDSNPLMGGELFEIDGDSLRVASLDGHRISIRKVSLKDSYEPIKAIVPGKTLNEISKIISDSTEKTVNMYFEQNEILFEFDNTKMVSRLIEGNYFDVDKMITSDYETKVVINKNKLVECIDRATLLVKEGDKKPIILDISDNNLNIKINSTIGSMDEDVDAEKSGKDIMIGFNPKFMIDALRAIDDEEISIYMVNPKAPCFIRNDDESYIYLILPINFTTVN